MSRCARINLISRIEILRGLPSDRHADIACLAENIGEFDGTRRFNAIKQRKLTFLLLTYRCWFELTPRGFQNTLYKSLLLIDNKYRSFESTPLITRTGLSDLRARGSFYRGATVILGFSATCFRSQCGVRTFP